MKSEQDIVEELRRSLIAESAKLTYFSAGLAASAIAFGFHETSDRSPSISLGIIGLALVVWGMSVAAGVLRSEAEVRLSSLDVNTAYLATQDFSEEALEPLRVQNIRWMVRSRRLYYLQLWFLLIGAVLYGIGHTVYIFQESSKPRIETAEASGRPGVPHAAVGSLAMAARPSSR